MCIWRNVFEETWAPVISALQEMKTKHVSDELTKKTMFSVPSFNYVIASKNYGNALILYKRLDKQTFR